ncbi:hypothetical protein WA556_001600, partial [Blastocystis sp. ATCC 50177/Nand II]
MEVVKEPENPLESCLRLLKGKKDEQKIAGLLLASKHLKPSTDKSSPSKQDEETAITLFHAVGLPFLEKLIRSPVDGDYASSYCAVGLAFVKNFCDYPSLQKDIVQLIVPMLQQLKGAQNDVLRRDILIILFSLSTNTQLLPFLCNIAVLNTLLSHCKTLSGEIASSSSTEEKSAKGTLLSDSITLLNHLVQHASRKTVSLPLLLSLLQFACSCPMVFCFSLLPSCSSLLSSLQLPSPSNSLPSPSIFQLLHWLMVRCFTYKMPSSARANVFEFVWVVIEATRFQWLGAPLPTTVPEYERSLSSAKLCMAMINSASIEVRVELDYLYKEGMQSYNENEVAKDKKGGCYDVALRNLFSCLHIVMGMITDVAASADEENVFSSLDYDTVINISTAWADTFKYVKEFVSLGLALAKTDIYLSHYKTNKDFIMMNTAMEYCSMFIDECVKEFPEEMDDEQLLED